MENVLVKVIGTQIGHDGEQDRIELIAKGQRQDKNGVTYITYREALSGLDNTTTLLKLYSDHVSLIRMGDYEQKQEFCPGRKTYGTYITPYGSMKIGVYTSQLVQQPGPEGEISSNQTISISYELEIDGQWQSANTLNITVSKA